MYLYQDLNKRPSTIDGYRTAIVDTLVQLSQGLTQKFKKLTQVEPFYISVVLNKLTKAPFDPMKDTDLKHLTLNTAFLLALASGKCRSEIHALVAKYSI